MTHHIVTTNTSTITPPAGTYPGNNAFYGCVLMKDGRVFMVPFNSTTARIYGTALPALLPDSRALSAYDNKF